MSIYLNMEVSEEQSNVMSNTTVCDEPGEEGEKKISEVWSQDMERNRSCTNHVS